MMKNPAITQKSGSKTTVSRKATEPFFTPATGANPFFQPKLKVGAPNDKYEQEADAVADQVVQRMAADKARPQVQGEVLRGSEPGVQRAVVAPVVTPLPISRIQRSVEAEAEEQSETEGEEVALQRKAIFDSDGEGTVQRKCATCAANEEEGHVHRFPALNPPTGLQRKCAACEAEEKIQPKAMPALQRSGDGGFTASSDFSSQLASSRGGGSPLPAETRTSMENGIGADFSGVRVHTGSQAASLSSQIGAQAFTHGSDVYFNEGKYDPGSSGGRRLLAHELTHTVQQGGSKTLRRKPSYGDLAKLPYNGGDYVMGVVKIQGLALRAAPETPQDKLSGKVITDLPLGVKLLINRNDLGKPVYRVMVQKGWLPIYGYVSGHKSEVEVRESSDDLFTGKNWKDVHDMGIVYQESGANIRDKPLPENQGSVVIKSLGQNSKVFIVKENKQDGWYSIVTDDGLTGYVAKWLLWRYLPEPKTRVAKIKAGSSPIGIAEKHYGKRFKSWGSDLRFVINALVYVNSGKDHNGIGRPGLAKSGGNSAGWATTKATADAYIWLPNADFLDTLKGKVSSGSITYEIWETVKAIGKAIAFGASFLAGILHGAFAGVVSLVKGIVDMVWGLVKSIIKGSLWSDLEKLWDIVTSMGLEEWKELLIGWMRPWLQKTESDNPFVAGHAWGYLTGRILFEIISLFVPGAGIAKALGKFGKLGKLLGKSKAIQNLGKTLENASGATKKGLAKLRKTAQVTKAIVFTNVKAARAWAKAKLLLTARTLTDLSLDAINRLATLPEWAMDKLRRLHPTYRRMLLGCASPCKVNIDDILAYLASGAGKAMGTRISSADDIFKVLSDAGMKTTTIKAKIKSHPVLVDMIKKLDLTDVDLKGIEKFLTAADKTNAKTAYETFTRYLGSLGAIKSSNDIRKFNELAAMMVKADRGIGSSLKGSMFETFAKVHLGRFKRLNFGRATFSNPLLKAVRTSDGFIKSSGAIWDFKHTFSNVLSGTKTKAQAADYLKVLTQGIRTTDGASVKSVNYLFPTIEAAENNRKLMKMGFNVYYVKPPKTVSKLK